jgi:hypothetical protein
VGARAKISHKWYDSALSLTSDFVSYCSCDVHFGDAAQEYPPHVEHRGYQNSRIVEKWAREHFVNPEQIFVTGSSAGAMARGSTPRCTTRCGRHRASRCWPTPATA